MINQLSINIIIFAWIYEVPFKTFSCFRNYAGQQVVPVSTLGIEPDIEVSTILAFINGFAFSTGEFVVVFEKETKFK